MEGGKFASPEITDINFDFSEGVANYKVNGEFNGNSGYSMIIRVQDSGEPGDKDNLRFELYNNSTKVYDSYKSNDFPGQSSVDGTARTYLDRGNIQVEDLR